ncbi:MAG TPA: hypothetical protein VH234_05075 [Candidatus Saccharimonadales bacterium]|jgi:hypothetical protein|nr:hypothetical protein [Candidatus Saccharimonadales bacterium]
MTLIKELLSISAGLIMLFSFIPYSKDILAGKVKPARSTRLMFVLLWILLILQQRSLGSGWLLAMSYGDAIGAVSILFLSFKKGVGGLTKVDLACYCLLLVDVIVWVSTGSAFVALLLSIVGDVISMTPVLIKTWRQPWTETVLFFALGVVAPLLNLAGSNRYSLAIIVFPIYIAVINLVEAILILYRQSQIPSPHKAPQPGHEPLS